MDEMKKISSKDVFAWCEKKSISLSDDVKKKLNDTKELTPEDLTTISGGCSSPIPKNPKCEKCGSTNTWTKYAPPAEYWVNCRNCGAKYTKGIVERD